MYTNEKEHHDHIEEDKTVAAIMGSQPMPRDHRMVNYIGKISDSPEKPMVLIQHGQNLISDFNNSPDGKQIDSNIVTNKNTEEKTMVF